jgi:hypothetical protein
MLDNKLQELTMEQLQSKKKDIKITVDFDCCSAYSFCVVFYFQTGIGNMGSKKSIRDCWFGYVVDSIFCDKYTTHKCRS